MRSGIYNLDLRVAAEGDGKSLHIEIDSIKVSENVKIPNTGGWQDWTTLTIHNIELTAGEHIMKVIFDANYMNLNYLEFKEAYSSVNYNKMYNDEQPFRSSLINDFEIRLNGSYEYRITAINGTVLEKGSGRSVKKVGTGLTTGVYLLSVKSHEGNFTRKVLKR
jgi:hypothetical protein